MRWNHGSAIYGNSYFHLLFSVLFAYNVANLCFDFFLSSFFRLSTYGLLISKSIGLITYTPYIWTLAYNNVSAKLTICYILFSNTNMPILLDAIDVFELHHIGLNWKSFLDLVSVRHAHTIFNHVLIFYAQSVTYIILGFAVEYIKTEIVDFEFKRFKYYMTSLKRPTVDHLSSVATQRRRFRTNKSVIARPLTQVYQIESVLDKTIVHVENVIKKIRGKELINISSLDLYENEITVLMGHNGSGKSMLLSMISNLIQPTQGEIIINGFDIMKNNNRAIAFLGVYLSDQLLFPHLNVMDTLTFFSLIKGSTLENTLNEVDQYLRAMNLSKVKHKLTEHLTCGERKLLAVCCALIGDSTVIILDDPTAGLDYPSLTLTAQLLNREKTGRTILLTSQSADDVELMADKVAIMMEGEISSYGTAHFLKSVHGRGYRLVSDIKIIVN